MKYSIIVTLILIAGTVCRGADTEQRTPEPSAATLAEAERLVRDVYKEDYMKRGPDERRALANKLLVEGQTASSDPASQYILLREARDLATQVGDIETAMNAASDLCKLFDIDPVDTKLKVLIGLRTSVRLPESQVTASDAALRLVDEALAAENFDAAGKAADAASAFATSAKNMQMVALVQSRRPEIRAQQQAAMESKIAADKLKTSPKDPEANLALGSYLALFKGDWDKALPMLAVANDAGWSAAAKADLANPVDVGEMTRVGDLWWDLSGRQAAVKGRIMARAEFWYNIVLPTADGLIRVKIEKRLEQIAASKSGPALGISEETRKLLPSATELMKVKELAAASKSGNYQKQQELVNLHSQIYTRLANESHRCSTADYFARCKADAQVRKVMTDNGVVNHNYSPLISNFSMFAQAAKTKEELATRLVEMERFNNVQKPFDAANVDSIVYSAIRSFVTSNIQQFNTQQARLQLCAFLKSRGVKSPGLDRYKQYVDRTRTAP